VTARIFLSPAESRGLLAGRVALLLRPVRPEPDESFAIDYNPDGSVKARRSYGWSWVNPHRTGDGCVPVGSAAMLARCPFGVPGDALWGAEAFALSIADPDRMEPDRQNPDDWDAPVYRADTPHGEWTGDGGKRIPPPWEPSSRMPRWASRHALTLASVRVVRVRDVSEEDARACGALFTDYGKTCFHDHGDGRGNGIRDARECSATVGHQQRNGWSCVPTTSADDCLGSARLAVGNAWTARYGRRYPWETAFAWALGVAAARGVTP